MSKKILLLTLIIIALTTANASAQELSKTGFSPLGNLLPGIQERSDSLRYISEEDWDVNTFVIGRNVSVLNAEIFKQANPKVLYETVEEFDTETFFARLEKQDSRWTRLRNYLAANLTSLKVFKVGDVRRDIYAVGLFDGHIVGVRMFAVET